MKAVHCSWVEMQKWRAALSPGKHGDQAALKKMLGCVCKGTVSMWKATADVMDVVEGKVQISRLSTFQPSHAVELARYLRRTVGKDKAKWDSDAVAGWVGLVEDEELTVEQFKEALADARAKAPIDGEPCCTTDDLQKLIDAGKRFGCIYVDPPWQYGNQATRASTDNHYATMSLDAIASLPVGRLAADKSHLWLWTTNGFLFECPRLFEAWGFEFKSSYVWVKPQMGIGNYLRNSHEFLLLAVRGGLTGAAKDVMSWGQFDRTQHSAKPEKIRSEVVERISPGPRLELFGRKRDLPDGWTVWGNGIRRGLFDAENAEAQ